ncbi:MAG: methanogen output domain 1-containing protein [Pararhodobacter sp.]
MTDVAALELDLDRDLFLRELLRQLAGALEDVVGLDEAEGYVSTVGRAIGGMLDEKYRQALKTDRLDKDQIAAVLVDLKRRIKGGFRIESVNGGRIVLVNSACPFGEKVLDRPSLCMMTMNVFGLIAGENSGHARVAITEAIATGAPGCRVVVDVQPTGDTPEGARDFFRADL